MTRFISIIALTASVGAIGTGMGNGTSETKRQTTYTIASTCSTAEKDAPIVNAGMLGAQDIVDATVRAGNFNTLAKALQAADLVDALKGEGPFTVFAPTDAAFAKLPASTVNSLLKPENKPLLQAILKYHVVRGALTADKVVAKTRAITLNGQQIAINVTDAGVMVDNASVTKTDIKASNGVIHVIDSVIMPETADILSIASSAGSFETLGAALEAAGLVESLKGKGPFTVFAPTDAAFAKLPEGTVTSLLKPENRDKLTSILTNHVVPGRIYAADALRAQTAETLEGSRVRIELVNGQLTVGGARVINADVEASNGVVHIIDRVLLP